MVSATAPQTFAFKETAGHPFSKVVVLNYYSRVRADCLYLWLSFEFLWRKIRMGRLVGEHRPIA
jgi:hypothetical protein